MSVEELSEGSFLKTVINIDFSQSVKVLNKAHQRILCKSFPQKMKIETPFKSETLSVV